MGILDERSRVSVEVDGFLRVEEHRLLRIHLDDEILQGAEPYHPEQFVLLLLIHIFKLSELQRCLLCCIVHLLNEVIGIHHRALTGLHLALRKFHHPV